MLLSGLTTQLLNVWAQGTEINLIDEQYTWNPYNAATITHNSSGLIIDAQTGSNTTLYNRAYMPIEISSDSNNPVLLDLEYKITTYSGNADFFAEVRDNMTDEFLWRGYLHDNDDLSTNKTFELSPDALNKLAEFRFNIKTDSPGEHELDIKKAVLRSNQSISIEP